MIIHQNLNKHFTLSKEHFERWPKLFSETLDEFFEGEKAILAKQKAVSIAMADKIKIAQGDKSLNDLTITALPEYFFYYW